MPVDGKLAAQVAANLKGSLRLVEKPRAGKLCPRSTRPRVYVVGSLRRGAKDRPGGVKDIDLMLIPSQAMLRRAPAVAAIAGLSRAPCERVPCERAPKSLELSTPEFKLAEGRRVSTTARVVPAGAARAIKIKVDLFVAAPEHRAFALLHYTGGREFNIRVRAHAKARGLLLNQYGLFSRQTGKRVAKKFATERSILSHLGVTNVPPSER